MRAQFIASEIGIGLRRNLSMTVSVVLVTTVSLFFLGLGILSILQVNTMKDYWYDRVQVSMFLCLDNSETASCAAGAITPELRQQYQDELESLKPTTVTEWYYESQDEAYERFTEQFADSAIVDNVTAADMPESFRVNLANPEEYEEIASFFQGRPGVEEVRDQRELLDQFFGLMNMAALGAAVVAALMLVCASLLVATTIRLAAFSRRRETGIMRLVGASNFFIQLPFVLEGMLAALGGALLGSAGIWALVHFLIQGRLAPALPFTSFVTVPDLVFVLPVMIVVGIVLAGVSSFVTLRRYLKV